MTKPDPEKRRQADAGREVTRLLKIAEKLAVQAEKPEAGAMAMVGIAKLRSANAGLDKRHASKVSVEKAPSVEDWVDGLRDPKT